MSDKSDEILRSLGVDPQLVDIKDDRRNRVGGIIDRRICICGHAVGRHKDGNGTEVFKGGNPNDFVCQPNARTCNCKRLIPVIKVSSPKFFLRITDGASDTHALIRGIRTLTLNGGDFEWLVEPTCVFCKATGAGVLPTPLTKQGTIKRTTGSDGLDDFVCENCRNNGQLG